jgi:hypothetical protein
LLTLTTLGASPATLAAVPAGAATTATLQWTDSGTADHLWQLS